MSKEITITTKHGTWTTTDADLEAAKWERTGEANEHYVATCDEVYGRCSPDVANSLMIAECDGDGTWSGIETDNLKARDEAGNEVFMHFAPAEIWSEDGRSSIIAYPAAKDYQGAEEDADWWNDEARVEMDDEDVHAHELMDMVGMPSEGEPGIDYAAAVGDWISDNCGEQTRYWVDDCRGFANEWTLYIDPQGRKALTLGDLAGTTCPGPAEGLREIDESEARKYIIDAVQTSEDYKREHVAESRVSAVVLD